MYIPGAFVQKDQAKLFSLIEAHSFGLLISMHQGEPFATHLPFLLERESGEHGTLVGHMARANPHWHDLDGKQVLAVFSGPHAYISPSWYEAEHVVPTWNYVTVHVYGAFRLVEDPQALASLLTATVGVYEHSRPLPWSLDSSSDFFQKLIGGIVGFRIQISRLEGKWKLNQNHSQERREKVIHALLQSESVEAREVARMMAEENGRPL